MHGQMFPGEHQKNHRSGFKQPATSNTNTHTPLGRGGKGQIRRAEGTKSVSLRPMALPHLRLTLRTQGLAFFSAPCLIYEGPRPTRTQREPGGRKLLLVKHFQHVRVRLSGP